ncbi:hypothetical protein FQT09_11570 [Enterococcus hirae]|nr:hypothetical protein [Enterococcus hirae]MBO1134991.1 hypothetical protein [Enterococcus hirae]
MYTTSIVIGILGTLLLIFQIVYFLKDYSLIVNNKRKKTFLIPNIIGIVGSISLLIISIIYFIIVNNQL